MALHARITLVISAIVSAIAALDALSEIVRLFAGDSLLAMLMTDMVDRIILTTRTIPLKRRLSILYTSGLAPAFAFYSAVAVSSVAVFVGILARHVFPRASIVVALLVCAVGGSLHLTVLASRTNMGWHVVDIAGRGILFLVIWFAMMLVMSLATQRMPNKPPEPTRRLGP